MITSMEMESSTELRAMATPYAESSNSGSGHSSTSTKPRPPSTPNGSASPAHHPLPSALVLDQLGTSSTDPDHPPNGTHAPVLPMPASDGLPSSHLSSVADLARPKPSSSSSATRRKSMMPTQETGGVEGQDIEMSSLADNHRAELDKQKKIREEMDKDREKRLMAARKEEMALAKWRVSPLPRCCGVLPKV